MLTRLCVCVLPAAAHICMYACVQEDLGAMGDPVRVVKLPKSGGVVQRSTATRQQARNARIQDYFYGAEGSLHPASVTMQAAAMKVFRAGVGATHVRACMHACMQVCVCMSPASMCSLPLLPPRACTG